MDEQKIRSNLKKLVAVFFIIFLLISGVSQFLMYSVMNLYAQSIEGRLKERALQYKTSFHFKMDSDMQILHAMACMLKDSTPEEAKKLLLNLWSICEETEFVNLCYFTQKGEGIQLTGEGQTSSVQMESMPFEMRYIIQQAVEGDTCCSHAYYDPVLAYNILSYAAPVYTDGRVTGVLAYSVSTEEYAEIFSSIDVVSDVGAAAVLTNDGRVLASTRTHQTNGFYQLDGSSYLNDEVNDLFIQALTADETQFLQFKLNGLTLYACIMPMDVYSDKMVIVDTDEGVSNAVSGMAYYARIIGMLFGVVSLLFMMAVLYINRRYNANLLQIAYRDRLTGAYNRHKFFQLLDQNRKTHVDCTVVSINIRKFKYVNELFSPAQSDQLLKDICIVLKRHMEPGEFFCRDTADTFVLSLKSLEKDVVRTRLEHMFSEINDVFKNLHSGYHILFYAGCASTVDCFSASVNEELMSHVMLARSHAKQSQPANIAFYDAEIHQKENLHNYIENHMEQALQNGEFQMYLQPKVDLTQKTLSGAEALVRWVMDGKQTIFPDQFIPIFEQNGFCIQLDYYMVEQACKQIRAWMDAGLSPIPISVNQTKLLFYEEDYVERICAITQRYQVPNHCIVLEILEGLALENPEKVSDCIDKLHSYGFRISMDDFGTGYSSLNTLSQLKIDELKLDRSFLIQADQRTKSNRHKILELVIEMARRMHISTVAEGIETAEDVELMREMHCNYGQGYYYSRPIPAEEFTKTFLGELSPFVAPWNLP